MSLRKKVCERNKAFAHVFTNENKGASVNGGTLKIWWHDRPKADLMLDCQSKEGAKSIARAIFQNAESRPYKAEWYTNYPDQTEILDV